MERMRLTHTNEIDMANNNRDKKENKYFKKLTRSGKKGVDEIDM